MIKVLYMFVHPSADSTKHRAVIETSVVKMTVVGVSSTEEGVKIAKQFMQEGVGVVELCGGFGYDGAKKVYDAVGDKIPVGMVVHQEANASTLAEFTSQVAKLTEAK